MVRPVVQHLESPLQDYEAGVEDFLMAHVKKLKPEKPVSPVHSANSSNSASRATSPQKTAEELRQEAREALRHAVFPQLHSASPPQKASTMAEKLWGGDTATEVIIESVGTGAEDPEVLSSAGAGDEWVATAWRVGASSVGPSGAALIRFFGFAGGRFGMDAEASRALCSHLR